MLDLMRKHAYSWLTRAVVVALIGVFAFWVSAPACSPA